MSGPDPSCGMPRMPWYPRDFTSSTRTWPLIARAVYRELLDISWDVGGLPAKPDALRILIGATPAEWKKAWPLVAQKFQLGADGMLRNLRLEKHRADAIELHARRHLKAKEAAAVRWGAKQ